MNESDLLAMASKEINISISEVPTYDNKQVGGGRNIYGESKGPPEKKDEAIDKDVKMKAVEAAIAGKIMGSYPYAMSYPLAYPFGPDLAYKAGLLSGLHNTIGRYEYAYGIDPLLVPHVGAVGDVLRVLEHEGSKLPPYPWEKKDGEKKDSDSTPAKTSLIEATSNDGPGNPTMLSIGSV